MCLCIIQPDLNINQNTGMSLQLRMQILPLERTSYKLFQNLDWCRFWTLSTSTLSMRKQLFQVNQKSVCQYALKNVTKSWCQNRCSTRSINIQQFNNAWKSIIIMNKRLQPYRKTPPQWLENALNSLPKLYIVGVTGHTSFILQDLKNIKYKITIANQIKCSCSTRLLDHCQHTLFVLAEVFYLDPKDPLIWQTSYLHDELRYMIANRRIRLNKISEFLKYVRPRNYIRQKKSIEDSDEEDNDNLCAICQEQILKNDIITSCTKICSNSFHLNCFKQWAEHQLTVGSKITCPLCRDQKQDEFILELRKKQCEILQQEINKKIGICYSYYCDGCMLKEIQPNKNVYKCVVCEDFILCQSCFESGKHIQHSFIVKTEGIKKWTYCEDRKNKKKFDEQQCLVRIKLTTSKFYNFLACAVPCYFSKNTRKNIVECKRFDINIEDLQCIACDDKQRAFLRRLYCGHFMHHKCLKRRIQKNKLFCKIDGNRFLLGYESLIKKQKLDRIIEQEPKDNREQSIQEIPYEQCKVKPRNKFFNQKENTDSNQKGLNSTLKQGFKQGNLLNKSINV